MAKIMTVRAPDNMHDVLMATAKEYGITRNALILQILREWLKVNTDDSA